MSTELKSGQVMICKTVFPFLEYTHIKDKYGELTNNYTVVVRGEVYTVKRSQILQFPYE